MHTYIAMYSCAAAARVAPERSALPGRLSGSSGQSGRRIHTGKDRRVRRRVLLASVPGAWESTEDERDLVETETGCERRTGSSQGRRTRGSGMATCSRLGTRGPCGSGVPHLRIVVDT